MEFLTFVSLIKIMNLSKTVRVNVIHLKWHLNIPVSSNIADQDQI